MNPFKQLPFDILRRILYLSAIEDDSTVDTLLWKAAKGVGLERREKHLTTYVQIITSEYDLRTPLALYEYQFSWPDEECYVFKSHTIEAEYGPDVRGGSARTWKRQKSF